MSRASTLFRLQEIDLDLDARLARLAEVEAALADTSALEAIQQQAMSAEARLAEARVAAMQTEHEVQQRSAKIAEVEGELYGGHVTNAKVLRDLQLDVESLKRRRGEAEERQLEALVQMENSEAELRKLQSALSEAENETASRKQRMLEESARLRTAVSRVTGDREAVLASVPADDLEAYQRLRRAKAGRAVARLEEGVCMACGVAPSSSRLQDVRQGAGLIRCGNCERILYAG